MDGLLIDSEPLWQQAEQNIFATVNIKLTSEQMSQTTGLRVDEVVEYWFKKHPWNEDENPKDKITTNIEQEVKRLIQISGTQKTGVKKILDFLSTRVNKIAIASSSSSELINTVVQKFEIQNYLKLIHSAENEEFGKPHPAVYLTTCEKLGVNPKSCIAFEDSLNGIRSAQAANIKCIGIPEETNIGNPDFSIADMSLNSLKDFGEDQWRELNK
ncbi:hexitol phosphatase HxpB [Candidatus Gracilibacteria bacterium]|nr:hexitol phosphatase HxpB [Candidatus Gracilibacteria bacterium]